MKLDKRHVGLQQYFAEFSLWATKLRDPQTGNAFADILDGKIGTSAPTDRYLAVVRSFLLDGGSGGGGDAAAAEGLRGSGGSSLGYDPKRVSSASGGAEGDEEEQAAEESGTLSADQQAAAGVLGMEESEFGEMEAGTDDDVAAAAVEAPNAAAKTDEETVGGTAQDLQQQVEQQQEEEQERGYELEQERDDDEEEEEEEEQHLLAAPSRPPPAAAAAGPGFASSPSARETLQLAQAQILRVSAASDDNVCRTCSQLKAASSVTASAVERLLSEERHRVESLEVRCFQIAPATECMLPDPSPHHTTLRPTPRVSDHC